MSDVTQILNAIDAGDAQATSRLLPLVYDELRRLAAAQMAREKPGHTLDATGLVHEAYIRLVASEQTADAESGSRRDNRQQFATRRHFFAAAAEAMRRILIESARRKGRAKRGGQLHRQALDPERFAAPGQDDDILALDDALQQLAQTEPEVAELVRLRHFVGLSVKDAAAILGIAPRTADAWWAYARTWLLTRLQGE